MLKALIVATNNNLRQNQGSVWGRRIQRQGRVYNVCLVSAQNGDTVSTSCLTHQKILLLY